MPRKQATATPVTMAKVRALLDLDEPKYGEAAKLGAKAIPHLKTLVREGDPMLASKATYLASLIQSDQAPDVVKAAAESSNPVVRVAAAAAARNLPDAATEEVLASLSTDEDAGVRKAAVRAAAASAAAPPLSAEKGPAPPESGGGSVGFEGVVFSGTESSGGDVAGDGGGSIDLVAGAVTSTGAAEGGGAISGTRTGLISGEGGGA
jgi:hypothetical protein